MIKQLFPGWVVRKLTKPRSSGTSSTDTLAGLYPSLSSSGRTCTAAIILVVQFVIPALQGSFMPAYQLKACTLVKIGERSIQVLHREPVAWQLLLLPICLCLSFK